MVAVSCRWCCGCSGAARRGCPFWCVPARWAGRIGRGPPRALWRGPGEGRWVTLGGVVLTVNGDRGVVERQRSGGGLVCRWGGGVLGGWGHGVERGVRVLGGPAVRVCPRRSRCRSCGGTHVLLPVWCLLRRADAAAVRGWLRRFAGRAEGVRVFFTVLLAATAPDPVMPAGAGSVIAAAVSAVAGAAAAAGERWPLLGQVPVWAAASAASGGRLLAPGWPGGGCNAS